MFGALRAVAALVALSAWVACARPSPPDVDLLLRGGTLIDGTGAAPRTADVAIKGGRIHAVGSPGELGTLTAAATLDVTGRVVAPGFVDLHSHADLILLADAPTQEALLGAKLRQGVTSLVVGNCGLGVAPATPDAAAILADVNGWMTPLGVRAEALSVADYLDRLETAGTVLNVGTLVPHGPLRISAMGLAAGNPTPTQLDAMRATLHDGLAAGAFGVSSGLIYPPGMFSATEELVELARVAAEHDALVTAHVRGSSETLLPATAELIDIARRSGARVHHSHLEAVGRRFWPDVERVLALEDLARAEGLVVSHDVFPYTRAATMMAAIFPPWALEGGVPRLLERLGDRPTRDRIAMEIERRVPEWPPWQPGGWPHNLVGAVGWQGILVSSVGPDGPQDYVGRSLAEIGRSEGRAPFDVVAALMLSEAGQVGQQVDEISGRGDEIDVLLSILTHTRAAVISDAEDYGRGAPHPAHAGAFARALRLNRERGLMPLEELIRRMTGYPASLIGLGDRGVIRAGAYADLIVLDPETVTDRATWARPRLPPEGIDTVVLNGHVVVRDERYLGGAHGRVLRHAPL